MATALWTGTALGFVVAAQVGPIWLLCARTTLRVGFASGFAIGAGAAFVDLCYAALGAAGVAPLLTVRELRIALGLAGGVVLVVLGARTLRTALRVRLGAELPEETVSPRAALRTGLVATASNPLTIASWAAVFGAASAGGASRGAAGAASLVLGVGIGSLAWHALLVAAMRLLRRRVGDRTLRAVDGVAGGALVLGGLTLGARSLRNA
ncbi:MAG TPA: LysE family transporter [Frankiaceae bacterium]|jgi:putative LysE/RhtB family amino acid efflux pump|nr:LysE family transporter [Frankiaceae bacterium]